MISALIAMIAVAAGAFNIGLLTYNFILVRRQYQLNEVLRRCCYLAWDNQQCPELRQIYFEWMVEKARASGLIK